MPSNLVGQTNAARTSFFREHQELLDRLLTKGQSPQIFFIGCNDSRVIPEAIMGAVPGDLFVFRSMANTVPPYGLGECAVGASLEYALHHLRVKHIIICGHTDCGGIHALDRRLDQLDEPHLARWVEYARPAQTQVDAWGVDPDTRHRAIVQQNVLLQLENLRTYQVVRQMLEADEVALHGWVYDLSTGWISYWDTEAEQFVDESEMR
jgi:carbonic anhydrase